MYFIQITNLTIYDKVRNIGQFKLQSEEKNHILIFFEDAYLTLVLMDC